MSDHHQHRRIAYPCQSQANEGLRGRVYPVCVLQHEQHRLRGREGDELIDERLQLQEAERLEIALTEQQLDAALEAIAQQNKMTKSQFDELLVKRQILPDTLREQVRGNLTWLSVVSRKLRPTIVVSEEEIDEVVGRIRDCPRLASSRLRERNRERV